MAGDYVIRWPLNMAQVAVSDGNLHREGCDGANRQIPRYYKFQSTHP